jgi:hypothetical protein
MTPAEKFEQRLDALERRVEAIEQWIEDHIGVNVPGGYECDIHEGASPSCPLCMAQNNGIDPPLDLIMLEHAQHDAWWERSRFEETGDALRGALLTDALESVYVKRCRRESEQGALEARTYYRPAVIDLGVGESDESSN